MIEFRLLSPKYESNFLEQVGILSAKLDPGLIKYSLKCSPISLGSEIILPSLTKLSANLEVNLVLLIISLIIFHVCLRFPLIHLVYHGSIISLPFF